MGFITDLLGIGGKGSSFQAQSPTGQQMNQVYGHANGAYNQQENFVNALNAQNGLGNQASVFAQQQGLANQLQNIGNGQGPNPAQAALNQSTGQNISAQAALMAGQRGAGSNPGLIARQVANQGANIQQQAVGQGATLQAQQQLAALQALQQQQGMLGGLANQQVGQQQAGISGLGQIANANQQATYSLQENANSNNAGVQGQTAAAQGKSGQGILSGLGSAITGLRLSGGGEVPSHGPKSMAGHYFANAGHLKSGGKVSGKPSVKSDSSKNDTIPAMLSPGEIVVPRSAAQDPEKAAAFAKAVAMRSNKRK